MTDRKLQSPLTGEQKRELWGDDFAAKEDLYLDEVEARWGDSTEYEQSAQQVASYGPREWAEINASNAAIEDRIRVLMDAGADPMGAEGMAVAEAQREHISRWFYVMDRAFHVLKSDLYVEDERFREGIEKNTRPGAAEWLRDAIRANAASHRAESDG